MVAGVLQHVVKTRNTPVLSAADPERRASAPGLILRRCARGWGCHARVPEPLCDQGCPQDQDRDAVCLGRTIVGTIGGELIA
jgi:hypothetical protein